MIGRNIYKIRMKQGLTLSELAERAQISKSYLSNIERNINQNPSIQIIEKIASVLKVDFRMLLGTMLDNPVFPDADWLDFVNELKRSGVKKEQLQEYKMVLEFAKWKKEHSDDTY